MLFRRRACWAALALAGALSGCAAAVPSAASPTGSTPAAVAAPSTVAAPSASPAAGQDESGVRGIAEAFAARSPEASPVPARAAQAIVQPGDGSLTGRTVVLDPGHNGENGDYPARLNALVPAGGFMKPCNTAGAQTDAGYPEHAFTWDVAQRAAALLRARGATVVLTRPDDDGFGPCVDVRAEIANAAHADAVVAVHADGAAAGDYGFHVIAPALAPDHGNSAVLATSWSLALALHQSFHAVTGEAFSTYVRGGLVRRSDLAGLNLSRVPAVFIECANMRNAEDAARVSSPAWRQSAAEGIAEGITDFLHR